MTHRVSAGSFTLAIPKNGVAILYENEKQLPGGVGYLDALVQFAGEVLRLNAEIAALRERLREQNAVSVTLDNAHAATRIVRDEALEEAATACEGGYTTGSTASTLKAIAAAIRALKEAA